MGLKQEFSRDAGWTESDLRVLGWLVAAFDEEPGRREFGKVMLGCWYASYEVKEL